MKNDNSVCDTLLSAEPAIVQKSNKTRKAIIGASVIGAVAMLVVACSGQQATETDTTELLTVAGVNEHIAKGHSWERQLESYLPSEEANI